MIKLATALIFPVIIILFRKRNLVSLGVFVAMMLPLVLSVSACGSSDNEGNANYYEEEAFSAVRAENEAWEDAELASEAAWKMLDEESLNELSAEAGATPKNARDSREAASLQLAALANVPVWSSNETITEAFARVRDTAFISWNLSDGTFFPRRSTWLYPDDGCFARAELMAFNLEDWGYPGVVKIFVFGNLEVTSQNAAKKPDGTTGSVRWWYHVAPILKSGENKYIVLDPSIDPQKPLPLSSWLNSMGWNNGSGTTILMSICPSHTYVPYDDCDFAIISTGNYDATLERQKYYLPKEWNRLVNLGRDPLSELGRYPWWLSLSKEEFSESKPCCF